MFVHLDAQTMPGRLCTISDGRRGCFGRGIRFKAGQSLGREINSRPVRVHRSVSGNLRVSITDPVLDTSSPTEREKGRENKGKRIYSDALYIQLSKGRPN